MMNTTHRTTGVSLAVAAAALLAGCSSMTPSADKEAMAADAGSADMGKCSGVNSCKGQSECATANSSCKGQNECSGKGWISLSQKDCEAKGGTFST
jgi:hypothetical protein